MASSDLTRPRDGFTPAEARAALEHLGRQLLIVLGEDPDRPGLVDTPGRWARWWEEFMGYRDNNTSTVFEEQQTDQMVVVSGLRVWSICEHHLLPFYADLTLAYIPEGGRVLGLSKFARIARLHAHRLQLQERLCQQIADHMSRACRATSVAVLGRGEHLCMTMRGARTPHRMTTSVLRGAFRDDARAREEFFHLAQE